MAAEEPVSIRPAGSGDVERILTLLEPQEFVRPLRREQLRKAFDYAWTSPKPNLGFVLEDRGEIVGYRGIIFSPPRRIDGERLVVANGHTTFVLPRYRTRHLGAALLQTVTTLGLPATSLTAKGPDDVVPRILARLGFELLSDAELFFGLGRSARTLLRPSGRVIASQDEVCAELDEEQRRVVRDHGPYPCRYYVVKERDRRCFVVTKRRAYPGEWLWPGAALPHVRARRFPVSDVLHLGDPETAVGSWGRLVHQVCLRERTVGLTCARSFLGALAPEGTLVPQRMFVHGRTTSARSIDKLYSELVLYP